MLLGRELAHLPRSHLKGEHIPELVIDTESEWKGRAAALYYPPWLSCELSDGRPLRNRHGVIVLVRTDVESSITHEIRHHQQAMKLGQHAFSGLVEVAFGLDYRAGIVRFFRSMWFEMDALRYEHRYARNDINRQWHEWVMSSS